MFYVCCFFGLLTEASFGGLGSWGPSPPKEKKKKKRKKKRKKRKKREKKRKRKKETMNSVKLLHIKCCFSQFFKSPVALKNKKKILASQEKVEMTPLFAEFTIVIVFVFARLCPNIKHGNKNKFEQAEFKTAHVQIKRGRSTIT